MPNAPIVANSSGLITCANRAGITTDARLRRCDPRAPDRPASV